VFIVDSNFQLVSSIKDSGGAILKDLPYLLDVHWYEHETNTYYKEVLCDTIFTISRNHHSLPHFILDFEKKKMPYKYYTNTKYYQMGAHKFYQLGNIIESGEYVFFQILFNRKSNYFIYHKTDKLLFDLGNRNPNHDLVQTFWPEYIDDEDIMYCLVNSIELTNMLSPSNTTQVIRQTLELNDNPVLISSKLKH
ncbi:MAG TPA: hypothetical protein VEP89_02085, partial [Draconibacterium sp.]|nr:hypothetical protein [Draconibacterium sp.]